MDNKRTSGFSWTTVLWLLIFWAVAFYFFSAYNTPNSQDMSYTAFKKAVTDGRVASVVLRGDQIIGTFKQPVETGSEKNPVTFNTFEATMPPGAERQVLDLLEDNNVTIKAESTATPWFTTLIFGLLPWVLIIGFLIYSSRKLRGMGGMGGGSGGPFGFAKSRAKLYTKSSSNITFRDVAGLDNAKQELTEIIEFLKTPAKFMALGGKLPRGVLLAGPPGTGKTLMARASAGEANVPFFSISGSEFVEMFVGVGASRVRDMFERAKKDSPSIIFIDELDSIGRVRGVGIGGGHDEREQTLNQILTEMDGFAPHESVVVMAATNRPDVLDPALVRPGRFDRRVTLDLPQKKARKHILEIHTRAVPLSENVDLARLADMTVGFSGADLENLVNEAALLAARKNKERVEAEDFDESRDKIIMGIQREEMMSDKEKEIVAYHEGGHALLAKLLPGVDPLQKVTIIPRSRALGVTEQVPEEERHNLSRTYLLSRIAIMLGGRVAERLVFNEITTGSSDDLRKASQIARRMVCQWGMSDKIGPATFRQGEQDQYLGAELNSPRDFSEHTARLIDEEVQEIIREMEKKAEYVIQSNRDKLDLIARALMEQETLSKADIDKLFEPVSEPEVKSEVPAKEAASRPGGAGLLDVPRHANEA